MRSTDFSSNSNKKAGLYSRDWKPFPAPKEEKRYCSEHPTGIWGRMGNGKYFKRCTVGNRKNEDCIIGESDDPSARGAGE